MHGSKSLHGGDLNENDNFKMGKLVMHVYIILYGDDLNENGNFHERKLVMHVYTILHGGVLNEHERFKTRKCAFDFVLAVLWVSRMFRFIPTKHLMIIYFMFWDRRINVISMFFCVLGLGGAWERG